MIHYLQIIRSYVALILFVALVGAPLYAQADDVNPEIANCEEVRDEATLTQMEFCSAHIGCNMVLKLQKACAKAKGFLSRLKANLFGRKEITNDDVFEASAPALTPSDALISKVSTVKKIVREQLERSESGKSTDKGSRGNDLYYEGGLKDGKWHGAGVYIASDGGMGRGQMNNGNVEGQAQTVSRSGSILAGDFVESMPQGNIAFQNTEGAVSAGVLLRGEKWSGVVEITKRDGDHHKELFDAEGKFLARGPVAKAGQVAIAPSLPEPSATERIAKQYDERIGAARSQCATKASSCQSGCATAGVVGVFAILATKGEAGGDTSEKIQQCSDGCDNEEKRCEQQVASLEREKKQAIAEAIRPQPSANSNKGSASGGTSVVAATGAGSSTPQADGTVSSGSGFVDVTLANRWEGRWEHKLLRVPVAAYDAAVARRKACATSECAENSLQYETGGLQNPYKLINADVRNEQYAHCKYSPSSYYHPYVSKVPPEKICSRLLQEAIHEDVETSVTAIRTGAGLLGSWKSIPAIAGTTSGNCKADLATLEKAAGAIRARRPQLDLQTGVYLDSQFGMYLAANKIRILENACKDSPEYARVESLRKKAADLHKQCTMFGRGDDACIPKVPW